MEIIVHDDQLSLAIGKKGQNVRLASRLTGWKTDIKSETEVEKTSRKVIDDLTTNLQVNEILARILFDEYLRDVRDIIRLTPEELNKITSISIEDCARIIENAKVIAANLDSAQAAKLESTEAAEPEPAQAANLESTEAAEPEPAQKGEEGEAAEGIALP
jgi:N utilization substance protein A